MLDELVVALITVFEGCKLTAYQDSGGVWTIGFGHTGPDVVSGLTITQEEADTFLVKDIAKLKKAVADKNTIEAAALISFGYNCGLGALNKVLAGSDMTQYIRDRKGTKLLGLQRRRALENALIKASKG